MRIDRQVVLETVLAHPETPAWAHPILRRALSGDTAGITITGQVIDAALLKVLRDLSIDPKEGEEKRAHAQRELNAVTSCEGRLVASLFCSCYTSKMDAQVDVAGQKVLLLRCEDFNRPTEETQAVALNTLLSCPDLPDWARPIVEAAKPGENSHAKIDLRTSQFDTSYLDFLRRQIRLNVRGDEWNARLQRRLDALAPWVDSPLVDFSCGPLLAPWHHLNAWISNDGKEVHHLEDC